MERAVKESGEWVLYGICRENSQDEPTETYVKKFDDDGSDVVIAMRRCPNPSVRLVGLRLSEDIKIEQTVKPTILYSVKVDGKVARSRKEAEEVIQRVTGSSIPRNNRIITDTSIFDEIETEYSHE